MKKRLFGTSGIRGKAKTLFTNQFCFDLGITFAQFLDLHHQKGAVAIGMDPRPSSPRILKALQSGLVFGKREVFNQGVSPTPALNWILKVSSYAGSVMITGSHIATHLNGVKFFAFKEEINKKQEKEITELYYHLKEKNPYQEEKRGVKKENRANQEYEEMLIKLADSYPCWRVVVDPGNGAQSELIPRLFSRLGLKVIAINNKWEKTFIARDTETEGAFRSLQKKVLQEKADFGVGFDADGDRVIFVDEKGNFIPGDYTGALIAKHSDTKTIVTPINTSQVVEYIGKPVIRTKVGSSYVIEAMKKYGATFGFEANGGGISAEIMMSRDGGSTAIKLLNILNYHQKPLSKLIDELPRFYLFRLKTDCPWELAKEVLKKADLQFPHFQKEKLDGLKIWLDQNTWILFRPSNNAPEFRVFAEAKKKKRAEALAREGIRLVKKIVQKGR